MTYPEVALRRLAKIVNGGTPTSDERNWGGDVSWATPVDLGRATSRLSATDRTLTEAGLASGSRAVPAGSIILSTRAPIGYVAITDVRMAFNQGCRGLVPSADVDARFLAYSLLARRNDLQAAGQGSTFMELSGDALAATRLPRPELHEQERIADFLDQQVALLDRSAALRVRQLELLSERFQAIRDSVFDAVEAPFVSLRYVADFLSDGDWIESPYIVDEGIRLIQTGNIGVGHYKDQGFKYVTQQTFDELACTEVRPGDVLISRLSPPVGRATLAPDLGERMIVSVDVVILRSTDVQHNYLVHAMSTRRHLAAVDIASRGTTMARISRSQLAGFAVPVPTRQRQREIAQELADAQEMHDHTREALARSLDLIAERKHALITGAVSGELDVTTARSGA